MSKIYVASSWKNETFYYVINELKRFGHSIYNFRQPIANVKGFSWDEIDPDWKQWSLEQYRNHITRNKRVHQAFDLDMEGLEWCDKCLLLLPCGRSAHLEAGYAKGAGKELIIYLNEQEFTPDLMYLMADSICIDEGDFRLVFA